MRIGFEMNYIESHRLKHCRSVEPLSRSVEPLSPGNIYGIAGLSLESLRQERIGDRANMRENLDSRD